MGKKIQVVKIFRFLPAADPYLASNPVKAFQGAGNRVNLAQVDILQRKNTYPVKLLRRFQSPDIILNKIYFQLILR